MEQNGTHFCMKVFILMLPKFESLCGAASPPVIQLA